MRKCFVTVCVISLFLLFGGLNVKEIFEKLKDCEAELHGMNEREAFISGFKLAARIMTEVLYEPSEN